MTHPHAITAIVVCRNEGHLLEDCLASLSWVDELLVVDLHSSDDSYIIARQYATRVLIHEPSPIVEPVRCYAAAHATNDWLLFVDPDERYPDALVPDIRDAVKRFTRAGIVKLPMHYYFKGDRLTCTAWGKPVHYRPALVHRDRCDIKPLICRGFEIRDGYEGRQVEPTDGNPIIHHWMTSYRQLVSKHWRYAPREAEARLVTGRAFSWRDVLIEPAVELKRNLIERRGLRGGARGVILSLTYSAFHALAAVHHRRMLRSGMTDTPADTTNANTSQPPRRKAA